MSKLGLGYYDYSSADPFYDGSGDQDWRDDRDLSDRDRDDEMDDDEMTVCVACGCPVNYGAAYCSSCYNTLESEGFFEP